MQYIIVGDTNTEKDLLIYVCGSSRVSAEDTLDDLLNDPSLDEMLLKMSHHNFRIKEVEDKDAWWLWSTD